MWNYFFYQDGSIEFEARLTGILQAYVAGPNEPAPYATRVAPGIHAHFHQHLFSVRIDPMVDGLLNSVIETDVLPATAGYGTPENFAGNAFQIHDRVLRRAVDGAREWDASADRRWRIVSAGKRHYASGQYVRRSHVIHCGSYARRRMHGKAGGCGLRVSLCRRRVRNPRIAWRGGCAMTEMRISRTRTCSSTSPLG